MKSVRKERIAKNVNIFDFALTTEEMDAVFGLAQTQISFSTTATAVKKMLSTAT